MSDNRVAHLKDETMSYDRVTRAVNFLISAPNYSALVGELTRIIENWHTHPMQYAGSLACLNAMIDVGVGNREAFERLVQLIEDKRKLHPNADLRRNEYQRHLMQSRRAREAKAMALHETRYGPIRGSARIAELVAIRERWARAKSQFVAAKGELSWDERNEVIREFWATVDHQLDVNLKNAQRLRVVA